jgi:hypothetical protein
MPATDREIEDWVFVHRFRYQFRAQYPFYTKGNKQIYGAAADEIFIGAGKNVGTNIFDQNRIFCCCVISLINIFHLKEDISIKRCNREEELMTKRSCKKIMVGC